MTNSGAKPDLLGFPSFALTTFRDRLDPLHFLRSSGARVLANRVIQFVFDKVFPQRGLFRSGLSGTRAIVRGALVSRLFLFLVV